MNTLPEIHTAIRHHLAGLDLVSDDQIYRFLFPRLDDLPSPYLFKSIDRAVELIIQAMVENHDILIWGDYDVDGITGTALLYNFFRKFDITPKYYIPNRLNEGYGLNKDALMKFCRELSDNKLLITVDCGISNHEELLLARRYGFRTIVTDHHQVPDGALYGDATINPQQEDCGFPFAHLAGVGVAFYLICAVRNKLRETNLFEQYNGINLKSFLDLVAIGTIADMMPLTGINRILVKAGIESISEGKHHGIKALFGTMDMDITRFTSETISFKIAPAINAAGRLGEPEEGFKMFTTVSPKEAANTAANLISLNNRRKIITEENIETALKLARTELINGYFSLVLVGDFHEGVLGIVASKLVETCAVPALVCCYDRDDRSRIKGSGRAPEAYDLYELLRECAFVLERYGGHKLAAGFSLRTEHFLEFKRHFSSLTKRQKDNFLHQNNNLQKKYCKLSISEAFNSTLLHNLSLLEPTGEDNPRPIFFDDNIRFITYSYVGRNKDHLKGVIRGSRSNIEVIGFNIGKKADAINLHETCSVAYGHSLDHYQGKARWKIQILDIWQ